jgi:hypothetical protein
MADHAPEGMEAPLDAMYAKRASVDRSEALVAGLPLDDSLLDPQRVSVGFISIVRFSTRIGTCASRGKKGLATKFAASASYHIEFAAPSGSRISLDVPANYLFRPRVSSDSESMMTPQKGRNH